MSYCPPPVKDCYIDNYSYNGKTVNGYLVEGKEGTAWAGNSIFLPAAGLFLFGYLDFQGVNGDYWSSDEGMSLYFFHGNQRVDYDDPLMGLAVRPVSK